jgi:G6PDH family F420-dependent oxidoreductase
VTCPTVRYHPAIVAQAAATLGVGAGERLNEHIVGQGFPSVRGRHERLVEALEIINLLWRGGYQSYQARHLQLEDARIFDLPDRLPVLAVAAGGRDAAALAATHGTGLLATEPRADLVETYIRQGGGGPRYAEVPLVGAPTSEAAVEAAHRTSRWALTGWKVMSELPNPAKFEAASAMVRPEDIREQFVVGPDPQPYAERIRTYAEVGFDHLVLQNAGSDPDGFLDFFAKELREDLLALGG